MSHIHVHTRALRIALAIAMLGLLVVSMGCAKSSQVESTAATTTAGTSSALATADPAKAKAFEQQMTAVNANLSQRPDFQPLPLENPADRTWFNDLSFKLWDGKVTKQQFVDEGVTRFPSHRSSIEMVASAIVP